MYSHPGFLGTETFSTPLRSPAAQATPTSPHLHLSSARRLMRRSTASFLEARGSRSGRFSSAVYSSISYTVSVSTSVSARVPVSHRGSTAHSGWQANVQAGQGLARCVFM